jgi:hypothetical protein
MRDDVSNAILTILTILTILLARPLTNTHIVDTFSRFSTVQHE